MGKHIIKVSASYVNKKGDIKTRDVDLTPEHFVNNPSVNLSVSDCENIVNEIGMYNKEEVLKEMPDADYNSIVDELLYMAELKQLAIRRIDYLRACPVHRNDFISTPDCIIR